MSYSPERLSCRACSIPLKCNLQIESGCTHRGKPIPLVPFSNSVLARLEQGRTEGYEEISVFNIRGCVVHRRRSRAVNIEFGPDFKQSVDDYAAAVVNVAEHEPNNRPADSERNHANPGPAEPDDTVQHDIAVEFVRHHGIEQHQPAAIEHNEPVDQHDPVNYGSEQHGVTVEHYQSVQHHEPVDQHASIFDVESSNLDQQHAVVFAAGGIQLE